MGIYGLQFLTLIVLLAFKINANEATELKKTEVSPGVLTKWEKGYYAFVCTVFRIFPPTVSGLPLKLNSWKERMLRIGMPKSCEDLILNVDFRLTSRNVVKLRKLVKEKNLPIFWILGGPGSGKGTMCKKMAKVEGFTHISVGDSLRSEVSRDPNAINSRILDNIMTRGVLLPDIATLNFLVNEMLSNIEKSKGFLIDGFPRKRGTAKLFQNKIQPPDAIIFLQVKDETMRGRLLNRNEGRADDNEETIKKRLKTFHEQQGFVLEDKMYKSKVKEIDGEGSTEEVFKIFSDAIHEAMKK